MTTPEPGTPTDGEQPAATAPGSRYRPIDMTRPHPARRYDAWLGGKDNFAADRESAAQIAQAFPTIRKAALENRRFLRRVVAFLAAEAGIRQFIDIGTGMPNTPNVHEIAQAVAPQSRVVYVDNDPLVVVHARALMASAPEGAIEHVESDLREPQAILTNQALTETLNLNQPVGVLLIAVLHFLDDADDPYSAVTRLVQALPPGSHLALSHATFDPLPADTVARLAALNTPGAKHGTFRARTRSETAQFLDGLKPVDPGLVPIVEWQPEREPRPTASSAETAAYGAVARLP
jgi:hypothetical protein